MDSVDTGDSLGGGILFALIFIILTPILLGCALWAVIVLYNALIIRIKKP